MKSLTLIDGKLIDETVYCYQDDKGAKVGSIAPVEVLFIFQIHQKLIF